MEVIEHVDPPPAGGAGAGGASGYAAPATVIVTTPNAEHNVRFETLPPGAHAAPRPPVRVDPRAVPAPGRTGRRPAYGYGVAYLPVGADDPEVGPPTQMAVFTKAGAR